jgi:hypothetical protein
MSMNPATESGTINQVPAFTYALEGQTVETLFAAWLEKLAILDSERGLTDEALQVGCSELAAIADQALALPAATALDVYRKVVLAANVGADDGLPETRPLLESLDALRLPHCVI